MLIPLIRFTLATNVYAIEVIIRTFHVFNFIQRSRHNLRFFPQMSYQLAISDWYPLKKNEIEKRLTWTTILVLVFFFFY